jgi:hypothetical protein
LSKKPLTVSENIGSFWAVAFFVLLIAAFYWKVLFGNGVFVFVDASRFFFPLWKWGAAVLRQGVIPLWNSDAQFGAPYLADPQMACAYPPVPFFYSWLDPINAFSTLTIVHHLWALIGFWFFAREQRFSPRVSMFGSLAFGFSLHVVCSAWTPVALMTISWLPWVFWGAEKLYRKEKGGLLYLSLAWAMQLSAGYPVLTYLTGLALLSHFGWRSCKPSREKRIIRFSWVGWFSAAVLIVTAYNLVWGLPFVEFFQHSNYEKGASGFQNLDRMNLATILDPSVLGDPLLANYRGPHFWVSTYFFGLPTLCLILWGAWRGVHRKVSLVLFFLFLILSLEAAFGMGARLTKFLPGYGLVIHSGFWISLLCLWAAWLAMESLENFLSGPALAPGPLTWTGAVVLIYGASAWLNNPYFSMVFWLSCGCLLLAVFLKGPWVRWILVTGALGLSLGTAAYSLNITLPRTYYEKPPEILSKIDRPGRLFFSPLVMGEGVRLQGNSLKDAYETAKEKFYPDWPLAFGKEEAPFYNTLQLKEPSAWAFDSCRYSVRHSRRVLDLLAVRYVFGRNQFKDLKLLSVKADVVSENPSPLPKWFTVTRAVPAGGTIQADFAKADKMGLNYGTTCFISDPAKAGSYRSRRVLETNRKTNLLELTAQGGGKALLISSETGDAGWRVWAEGKPRLVENINHAFRGVVLNEGEERVRFRYEPLAFRLGMFLALLVCGVWLMLGLLRLRHEF